MLHGAAETEPRGQRDAARGLLRQIAKIESDQSETSAFEQQVGSTQKLFQALLWGIFSAAHPQQSIQFDSRRGGRLRIESITGIHQHAAFSAPRGSSQSSQQQGGAAGRSWTANFRQATARQTSSKGIHRGDAAGYHFRRRPHRQLRGRGNAGEPRIFRSKDRSRKDGSRKSSLRRPPLDAKLGCGRLGAIFGVFFNQNKRAALGRRSGNHCGRHRFLGKISGNAGAGKPPEAFSLFIRLKNSAPGGRDCQVKIGESFYLHRSMPRLLTLASLPRLSSTAQRSGASDSISSA